MLYNINWAYTLARVKKKLYLCKLIIVWSFFLKEILNTLRVKIN